MIFVISAVENSKLPTFTSLDRSLSVCLFVCLFVSLFVCLFVCLFIDTPVMSPMISYGWVNKHKVQIQFNASSSRSKFNAV